MDGLRHMPTETWTLELWGRRFGKQERKRTAFYHFANCNFRRCCKAMDLFGKSILSVGAWKRETCRQLQLGQIMASIQSMMLKFEGVVVDPLTMLLMISNQPDVGPQEGGTVYVHKYSSLVSHRGRYGRARQNAGSCLFQQ